MERQDLAPFYDTHTHRKRESKQLLSYATEIKCVRQHSNKEATHSGGIPSSSAPSRHFFTGGGQFDAAARVLLFAPDKQMEADGY